jgi:uncharacterized damage-inducible protein DinB
MSVEHFRAMARNNAWSNYRLHNACAQLSDTEYRAKRVSFFPSLPLTLSHIYLVDCYYLDALEEGGRGLSLFEQEEPFATLDELTLAQFTTDRRLMAFCDRLTAATCNRAVSLHRGKDLYVNEKVEAVLNHLFVHQIHHRGQVHAMLAGTSVKPPQLDEFFLAQDEPLRRHELLVLALPLR